jgi:hypothetical protein
VLLFDPRVGERYGLIYKSSCQKKYFSLDRKAGRFPRHPAPLSLEDACRVSLD